MGTYHTKGSQETHKNNLEIHWIPSGLFCLFFSLLLGHMLIPRFSAQEKKRRVQSNGDGDQES